MTVPTTARQTPESASPVGPLPGPIETATEAIRADHIMQHVCFFCDPKLKGRSAGGAGARMAADYIAARFRKNGLSPGGNAGSYFQPFKIRAGYHLTSRFQATRSPVTETKKRPSLTVYERRKDYMPVHIPHDRAEVDAGVVVVGYGITSPALRFDEYEGVDARGKAVLVFSGVPWSRETASWLWRLEKRSRDSLIYKARTAAAHGAVIILLVEDPAGWQRRLGFSEQLRLPDREFPVGCAIPVIHVTRRVAAKMAGMSTRSLHEFAHGIALHRQPQSYVVDGVKLQYSASITGSARIGRNVIGVLPGGAPGLREQSVVIGAHYDHLGEGIEGTYFGANDNASGVAAMLEISRAFRMLPERPKRTIVFIGFAAEEIGKLGSNYYVTHAPMPVSKTVLMVNFDMIGRNEPNQIWAVATRSSSSLHELHQHANQHVGLELIHPRSMRLGRADHTAFYLAHVPVMYLFGGLHPGYHSVHDTVDRLVPGKIEKTARLAFLTAWMTAERDMPLPFTADSPDWY